MLTASRVTQRSTREDVFEMFVCDRYMHAYMLMFAKPTTC